METAEQIAYREDVNRKLYRKILSGIQFQALMPHFQYKIHYFDKEQDNSNTFDTLEFMAQWTNKYASQMSKIAPLLKARTLKETIDNIYKFLYWHFQYKLDGNVQDLHSPSSAWRNRKTGFDCKTYSILAGCILTNLKIPYSFRMVQLSEPKWSHVYVVVPNGDNYFVIDATKHQNTEVNFSKKFDKIMIHRGLANPLQNTMLGCPGNVSCACSGKPLAVSGLGNPQNLQNSIDNLHAFLSKLDNAGVPRRIINNVLTIVRENINQGIDPNMDEVFQKAIMFDIPKSFGLGVSVGEVITNVAGAYNGDVSSMQTLLGSLIPSSFLSNTFGAVFSNGFMLSCWGASLTPQKAADSIKNYFDPHFNYRLNQIQQANTIIPLQNALNEFIKDVYILHKYFTVYKPVSANWSGCAKKAINEGYIPYMNALKTKADQLITEFTLKGATIRQEKIQPIDFWFRKAITGKDDVDIIRNEADTAFADYPQLTLSPFTVPNSGNSSNTGVTTTTGNTVIDNGNGTVTVTNPSTGASTTIPKDQAISSGIIKDNTSSNKSSLLLPALGIGGLAAFMIFSPKEDVTKTRNKKNK